MARKKIAYIISLVNHSVLFTRTLQMLDKNKFDVSVILLHHHSTDFEQGLTAERISVQRIYYKSKHDMPRAIARIARALMRIKPDIVHTHLFEAGLAGMSAARLTGIKRRIHTRHDATIHHDYHPGAVKYDKMINRMSTDIIAITENVKKILTGMENVSPDKIRIIHHGFDIGDFSQASADVKIEMCEKYFNTAKPFPVIGVVSRLIEWKGIQYIIPAFKELRKEQSNAHLILANATGPYADHIHKMLEELPTGSYTLVKFEKSIAALYSLFDIFVHVPVDEKSEAFGQVYIEAMSAGIPSIITKSGIACDYAESGNNCLIVPYKNSAAILEAMKKLLSDDSLRNKIAEHGKEVVLRDFTMEKMIAQLESMYNE